MPGPDERLFWQDRLDDVDASANWFEDDEPPRLDWRAPVAPAAPAVPDTIRWQPPSRSR